MGKCPEVAENKLEAYAIITAMGAANTLFRSGMSAEEEIDLIPVKPLGEEETIIKAMYGSKLRPLYEKSAPFLLQLHHATIVASIRSMKIF